MKACELEGIPPHRHPAIDIEGELGPLGPLARMNFDNVIFAAARKYRMWRLRVATMGTGDSFAVAAQATALLYAEG